MHGLCDVDLFLSFVQKDNSTKNITVAVANKNFQDCNFTMDAIEVVYKTVIYLKNWTNGTRLQISNYNLTSSRTTSLKTKTTTPSATTSKQIYLVGTLS